MKSIHFEFKKTIKVSAFFFFALFLFASIETGFAQSFFNRSELNPFHLSQINTRTKSSLADFDNDGDMDLISGTGTDTTRYFKYFENSGGVSNPNFNEPTYIEYNSALLNFGVYYSTVADLDNDQDVDILFTSWDQFIYFENSGTSQTPIFTNLTVNPFNLVSQEGEPIPTFVDLDGDLDQDLIVAHLGADLLHTTYFENIGTRWAPHFVQMPELPFNIRPYNPWGFSFADLDRDGDKDILTGSYQYYEFEYYENTGSQTEPNFCQYPIYDAFGLDQGNTPYQTFADSYGYHTNIPTNFVDLDNDGDLDFFSSEDLFNPGIYFYENIQPTDDLVYPNPTGSYVRFQLRAEMQAITHVEVSDLYGVVQKEVFATAQEPNIQYIHTDDLQPGFYMLRLSDNFGNIAQISFQKL